MAKNYWMIACTLESLKASREAKLYMQEVTSTYRRRVQRMQPEDRLLFYVPSIKKFGGTATVTAASLEEQRPKEGGRRRIARYSLKINVRYNTVPDEESFLDAREIGPRMDYVDRWPPERWNLAFLGQFHMLPRRDFELVEGEINRVTRGSNPRPPKFS
ncbi:MAG: hypothetical protein HY666_06975 [Chloroflexi bacterium]|nr:hypothetical protein [Chloroflexota bacterium]